MGALDFGTQPSKHLKGGKVATPAQSHKASEFRTRNRSCNINGTMKLASAIFMTPALLLFVGLVAVAAAAADEDSRDEKIFSFLELVRIPNDLCAGTSKNGTCYTADECKTRGGTESGKCGGGYGVCCIVELACGGESSDNNTYIVQAAKTTFTADELSCNYKICPAAADVTRIRFDFTAFVLAQPSAATNILLGTANTFRAGQGATGRCLTDSFAITGSPEICGTNTGQHMILDSDGKTCLTLMFAIGSETSTSRSWDILATQYRAGQEEVTEAGPCGCLQYHIDTSGYFSSFNFPALTALGAATTHLANQKYNICIRRASGMCQICYFATAGTAATLTDPGSFGLSAVEAVTPAVVTQSQDDTQCSTDYLVIPNAGISTGLGAAAAANNQRFCGRFLATVDAATANQSICTTSTPFVVGVVFDDNELNGDDGATMPAKNEIQGVPAGTLGFGLFYNQLTTGC